MHRFDLHSISPVLNASQNVALCIGIDGIKPLPADDPEMEPFLHLPLSDVDLSSSSSQGPPPTKTFLIATKKQHEEEQGARPTFVEDPWSGKTLTLRAEFVETSTGRAEALAQEDRASSDATFEKPPSGGREFLAVPRRLYGEVFV